MSRQICPKLTSAAVAHSTLALALPMSTKLSAALDWRQWCHGWRGSVSVFRVAENVY